MNRRLQPIATEVVEALEVRIYRDRQQLGAAAGQEVGAKMRALLGQQAQIRVIFAAAPSQNEFLQTLSQEREIDWSRVSVFHMDEYLGLAPDAPRSTGLCADLLASPALHPSCASTQAVSSSWIEIRPIRPSRRPRRIAGGCLRWGELDCL
ncbi:MAG TPA: hypothetical protein VKB35_18525, partial [Ktedonobacteraceae bacterium]|nr:hypothetical protein [Ktedonobacteraceae bacterium]